MPAKLIIFFVTLQHMKKIVGYIICSVLLFATEENAKAKSIRHGDMPQDNACERPGTQQSVLALCHVSHH